MTIEFLTKNWALVIASILSLGIFLFVVYRLYEDSGQGRLSQAVRELRAVRTDAKKARRRLKKAEQRLASLQENGESLKPRLLAEAEEAAKDADLLVNITGDQVMRAEKILRDVILEEFPPNRQDVLRSKYL